MPCSEWENLISEYIDGELPAEDAARVEQHLLECSDCAEFFKGARADGELVSAAFDLPHLNTAAFAQRVMDAIQTPVRHRDRSRWPWAVAAVAASILLAFLVSRPTNIGRVTKIMDRTGLVAHGGVELRRAGAAEGADLNSLIKPGDTIQTTGDRVVFVALKTGDEVAINASSSVTLAGEDDAHRNVVVVNKGETFVRAAKGKGSLVVATEAGTATVLGTEFSVLFDPEALRTAVTVLEGTVRFHNSLGEKIVTADQQSVASADSAPSQPKTVDAQALTAWVDPPSAARLEQVARALTENLSARVEPSKSVFEVGEPIYVTVALTNHGENAVQLSRGLFIGREDTAARRMHYKLSQIMLTRIFGSGLETVSAELPAPELAKLRPGQTRRVKVNLIEGDEHAALRTIRGPGAYSVSVVFAVAAQVPGAPDDSMVWADVDSESVILRVISPGAPRAGRAVGGLQLGLSGDPPGCRLGDTLLLQFTLKGVTSDVVAVSTGGEFRLKVEPVTYGKVTDEAADSDLPGKLEKTLEELGIEERELSLRGALDLLPRVCGINVLADSSVMKEEAIETQPAQTLGESLQRLCEEAGAAVEVGRAALWFVSAGETRAVDVAGSLAKLEGKEGWIRLEGVDSRDGALKLTTGGVHFPRPGLYRCTVEYSNRQTKEGPDWPAAWLGSVKSNSMVLAVLAPTRPEEHDDNGLSLRIREAGEQAQRTIRLAVELRNTSDKAIVLRPGEAMKLSDEWLLYDILNPECYKEADRQLLQMLEKRHSLNVDEAGVNDAALKAMFAGLSSLFEAEAVGDKKIYARAEDISAGEVLEFIARMSGVSFMRSGDHKLIIKASSPGARPNALSPSVINGADATGLLTIPAGERRTLTVTAALTEPGRHRLQVRFLHTGLKPGEEGFWTGEARSNPLIVEIK